jgi:hypothetical protein
MSTGAHLETSSLTIVPGAEAAATVRVRNMGTVVDQFSLDVVGDAQPWAEVQPPSLSLFPGAEERARIVFRPPRSPHVPAGRMPFGVRVRSRIDPASSRVEEGALQIEPFYAARAEMTPRSSRGTREAFHDVTVENSGNAPFRARLSALDYDQQLELEIPQQVVVGAGQSVAVRLTVKARQVFEEGAAQQRPFRVVVQAPDSQPITVDGTFNQEPVGGSQVQPLLHGALRAGLLLLRNLPAVLFIAVVVPLAVRLAIQLITGTAVTGLFANYTDIWMGPFGSLAPPSWLRESVGLNWDVWIPSTSWTVLVALLGWGLVWLVAFVALRLFRR